MASSAQAPWLVEAGKLVGLKEIIGSQHEPKVVAFFKEAGFPGVKDDETAWCAAFANAMLNRAAYEGTKSLAARSFVDYGVEEDMNDPRPGAICVWKRGSSSWQGHVNFFVRKRPDGIWICRGGNQSNAVTDAPYDPNNGTLLAVRWPRVKATKTKPADVIKPATKSKIAVGGGTVAGSGVVIGVEQIGTAIEHASRAKEIGMLDYLWNIMTLWQFWLAVFLICIGVAIAYWRWRDHGRGGIGGKKGFFDFVKSLWPFGGGE